MSLPVVDGDDARRRGGGGGVDAGDPRIGVRAAQDIGVELARPVDVVGVGALAGQEAVILAPPDRRSDDAHRPYSAATPWTLARLLAPHHRRPLDDRQHDVVIAGAAAEIAFEILADLALGRIGVVLHQIERAHDHAGRAEPALQGMIVAERLLHRMQGVAVRDGLDGQHRAAFGLHRQQGASLDGLAVDMDDAGAALAGVAADMRAGQTELLAQQLHQQGAAFDRRRNRLAVHGEAHRLLHRDLPASITRPPKDGGNSGRSFMPPPLPAQGFAMRLLIEVPGGP